MAEMVTRTFIKSTDIQYKAVKNGVIDSEVKTLHADGNISDPIRACKKAAGLSKFDSVLIVKVDTDTDLLGMTVEEFKAHAIPVTRETSTKND